jgi:hypothetical protein
VAVVTGMLGTFSVGGVAWDYGQYALGMERLGYDVYYLEDTGLPTYTFHPDAGSYEEDCTYGVEFIQRSLASLSPTLADRWHFRAADGQTYGLDGAVLADIVAEAELLLNVSGGTVLRDAYRRCRRTVFIDTDPGWNHFVKFPEWDARPWAEHADGFRGHTDFFTYASRLGQPDCPLPTFGLPWRFTRPPVVLDCWDTRPPGEGWTTAMMWNNYGEPVHHAGVTYGSKERELVHVEHLPAQVALPLEIAVNGDDAPRERWRSLGWSVVEGRAVTETVESYRAYVERSRGEFSVAKNIYVATRSGWFSCRSVCYLAAGRPVVVQDTGFAETIPVGCGLLSFSTASEAVDALLAVERDYDAHRQGALEVARRYFDADRVLGDLLHELGLR